MNRRSLMAGMAALVPATVAGQATPQTTTTSPLRRYVEDVLANGNTDILPEIADPEIAFPQENIAGLDYFTWRAASEYAARQEDFSSFTYTVRSSFSDQRFALLHADVQAIANDGAQWTGVLLWAAELRDERILTLYAGAVEL